MKEKVKTLAGTNSKTQTVEVKPTLTGVGVQRVKTFYIEIPVIGETPLLTNAVPVDIDGGVPEQDQDAFYRSLYHFPGGGYGFPCVAFKRGMERVATTHTKSIKGTNVKGTVFTIGEDQPEQKLVKLSGSEPRRFPTKERNQKGQLVDVVYGLFEEWRAMVRIKYQRTTATPWEKLDIINLLYNAGQLAGIGRWRPELGGSNGMYIVDLEGIKASQ